MKSMSCRTAFLVLVAAPFLFGQNPAEWPILYNTNHLAFSATTVLRPPLKVKWAAKIHSVVQNPGPVIAEGRLVINDAQGYLYCMDAETGELKWRFFQKQIGYGGGASSPAIWNGRVYCAFFSRAWPTLGGMHCFDLNTGEVLWKETRAGLLGTRIKFSPQVSKGRLFYISNVKLNQTAWDVPKSGYRAQVQCWDALTGDSLWTCNVWDSSCQNTTILVVGDTVFASVGLNDQSTEGKTVVLDLDGNVRWTSTTHHVSGYLGNLQYLPGKLVMLTGSNYNAVRILNTSDWSLFLNAGNGDHYSKINAFMNGKYWNRGYAGPPGSADASTGVSTGISTRTFGNETFWSGCASPVAANGYVYSGFGSPVKADTANGGHKWYAWDESGTPVWSFQAGSNCCPSLAIAYDKLYAVTGADGLVYCFENAE